MADPTVITSTEGKADIIGCLYADPANRAESRALTLTIVDADPSSEQPTVTIATPEHGTVSYSLNGQERTLTVKPDAGYYIRKSDITVQKTIAPNQATARNMVPVADNLELEGTDDPVQSETAYTFTIPAGYDAYVTATFTACTVPELSVSIEGWTFGETPNEPTVSGNDGDAAVTYTYAAKGSDDFSADVPSAIGEYTVKASVPAIGIYTSKEATADFSIAAYTETISFAAS